MFAKHYAKFYDTFNSKRPYKDEVNFVYRWAKKPKSIFDIGAGTGSYWKFYPKNVSLLGVDKSKAMISMAQRNRMIIHADITRMHRMFNRSFDCATALFDVMNYIPNLGWWKNIPVKKGGYLIFDIWDKAKVDKQLFTPTYRQIGKCFRSIIPYAYDGKSVMLKIFFYRLGSTDFFHEEHKMYLHSDEDIAKACGKDFIIVDSKPTNTWQKWYKLKKQ